MEKEPIQIGLQENYLMVLVKQEKYTILNLFDNYNRDPGMVSTVSNRQYNTQALRDRGGAHIFYGLAEIKIDK